jgi:hypothetical protein
MKNKRLRRAVSRTRRHLAIATDKRLINSGRRYDPKTTGQREAARRMTRND